ALLPLVGFGSGFVDAIAGGGGLLTAPSLALAGLDPVAAVATNKLAGTFGAASATLPFAPRALLSHVLPFVLIGIALYFAFAPSPGDAQRRERLSPAVYATT